MSLLKIVFIADNNKFLKRILIPIMKTTPEEKQERN